MKFGFLIPIYSSPPFKGLQHLLSPLEMKKKKLVSVKVEKTGPSSSISPNTPPRLMMAPQGVEEFLASLKEQDYLLIRQPCLLTYA